MLLCNNSTVVGRGAVSRRRQKSVIVGLFKTRTDMSEE